MPAFLGENTELGSVADVQDANETLIKDLNGIITDRQASVRAIDAASTLSRLITSLLLQRGTDRS